MNKQLRIGRLAEDRISRLLELAGATITKPEGKFKPYDLSVSLGKMQFTVEVKYDVMAVDTGNIAIEYENCRDSTASGITATEADLWAHCIKDGTNIVVFVCPVSVLKEYINTNKPKRVVNFAGDQNASLMLYGMDEILEAIFTRIDVMEPARLQQVIRKML